MVRTMGAGDRSGMRRAARVPVNQLQVFWEACEAAGLEGGSFHVSGESETSGGRTTLYVQVERDAHVREFAGERWVDEAAQAVRDGAFGR
jgi:hypothetical protein